MSTGVDDKTGGALAALSQLAETAIEALTGAVGRPARQRAAVRLHTVLVGVLRGKAAVDLALGETLAAIQDTDAVTALDHADVHDYARERIGWSRSQTASRMRLARGLRRWPKVRAAVREGRLSPRKAQVLLGLLPLMDEDAALLVARTLTVAGLEARVRRLGGRLEQDDVYELALFQMTPDQRTRYEEALRWAQYAGIGLGASRGRRTACLAMEFLGDHEQADDDARAALERMALQAGETVVSAARETGAWSAAWDTLDQLRDAAPEVVLAVESVWRQLDEAPDEASPETPADWLRQYAAMKSEAARSPGHAEPAARSSAGAAPASGEPDHHAEADAAETLSSIIGGLSPPADSGIAELHRHAVHLAALRLAWDGLFGRLVYAARREAVHRLLGAPTWATYCADGLGLTPQAVGRHVRLERQMQEMPPLRHALRAGRLNFSQACAVGRVATPETVEAVIADAEVHPAFEWEKARRDEADGIRCRCGALLWDDAGPACRCGSGDAERTRCGSAAEAPDGDPATGPEGEEGAADAGGDGEAEGAGRRHGPLKVVAHEEDMETIRTGLYAMQLHGLRQGEGWLPPGEALARLAEDFVDVWKRHVSRPSRKDRELLARTDGLCQIPGCTRGATHRHHVVYRSHQGANTLENLVLLCGAHHLRAVHQGSLVIRGRAGVRLTLRFQDVRRGEGRADWVIEGASLPRVA